MLFRNLFLSVVLFSSLTQAGERNADFRNRTRGPWENRRGNENSIPVTQVQAGTVTYGGNGCPQNTLQLIFSPDYLSFTILFDHFLAEMNAMTPIKNSQAMCEIYVPLSIPQGTQMEISRIDLRGFTQLPAQSTGFIKSTINFRGRDGDRDRLNLNYAFQGPVTDNFVLSSDQISNSATEVSSCGGQIYLHITNQLRIVSRTQDIEAQFSLDSIDGTQKSLYFINWKSCSDQGGRRGPDGRGGGSNNGPGGNGTGPDHRGPIGAPGRGDGRGPDGRGPRGFINENRGPQNSMGFGGRR